MFVPMKKLLCLLTVCLMCAVSYGATPVTAKEKGVVIAVVGHGAEKASLVSAVLAMQDLGTVFVVCSDSVQEATKCAESLNVGLQESKVALLDYRKNFDFTDFEYLPPALFAPEKPKHYYSAVDRPYNTKPIANKNNLYRKARSTI